MSAVAMEVTLGADDFRAIADLAYRESGIRLPEEKRSMIQSRLRHRLRTLGYNDFAAYTALVCSDGGISERRHMISALTTNVSHFFRENHHFDLLRSDIGPRLVRNLKAGGRVRIWSAGCSNGQEAYSIAILMAELFPGISETDFRILATDIDPNVVSFGAIGLYPEKLTSGVPHELLGKYFSKETASEEVSFSVKSKTRNLVTFKELNLHSDWPMKQKFDVIFCRNVVIYFDLETQNRLWPRFRGLLETEGVLFLGHSERIASPADAGFRNCGPTTYRPIK